MITLKMEDFKARDEAIRLRRCAFLHWSGLSDIAIANDLGVTRQQVSKYRGILRLSANAGADQ